MSEPEIYSKAIVGAPRKRVIIQGHGLTNLDVEVAVVDGQHVLEGDIVLSEKQIGGKRIAYDSVIVGDEYRWPDGIVPYELDAALSMTARTKINSALAHWNANSKIRFVARTGEPDYVHIFPGDGLWSFVGRQGGRQNLSLSGNFSIGNAVHELGHTIGFWHTHSREDRDEHVTVNYSNIDASAVHNFDKHTTDGDDVGPYGYASIMHYGPTGFSTNGKDTITSPCPIGQRRMLDVGNVATCGFLYGYPASRAEAEFYSTSDGLMSRIQKHTNWRRTWTRIVPGNFGGSNLTDLFFYDAARGEGELYVTGAGGAINIAKKHKGLRSTWQVITPGRFGTGSTTSLFFYDPKSGQGEFYATDGLGNISLIRSHSGFRKTWTHIVVGNFGTGSMRDLLFYDGIAGEGEFYTTDASCNLTLLKKHSGWRKTWAQIVPGNFGGTSHTDLLFYDWRMGEGEFYTTDGAGNMTMLKKHTGWRTSWTQIVPGNFGGTSRTDLLFYDPSAGEGEFYTTNLGEMALLKKCPQWRTSWTQIVPGSFAVSPKADRTDLLFYEAASQP